MRNTGSREKWRGNRSRGLRKAPGTRLRGRTPRRAARPPPRLHSDLVSPEPRAPGLLTSRPLLLQRAAQPQLPSLPLARPGSDFCSCAPSPRPAPHALGNPAPIRRGGAGPGGAVGGAGRGGGRPQVRTWGEGHTHPRDHTASSPSPGEKLTELQDSQDLTGRLTRWFPCPCCS